MELVAQTQNGDFIARVSQAEAAKLLNTDTPALGLSFNLVPFINKVNWMEQNIAKLNQYATALEGYAANMRNAATALEGGA